MSLTFTLGKIVNLGAAASGALGTALLFKGSFSYEAPAAWVDEKFLADMAEFGAKIDQRSRQD